MVNGMTCSFKQMGTDEKTGYHIYSCINPDCPNQHITTPHEANQIYAICIVDAGKPIRKSGPLPTSGLGDLISNVLAKLGITEKTVNRWLGIQEGCGCDKRKKFLNTILPFRKKE